MRSRSLACAILLATTAGLVGCRSGPQDLANDGAPSVRAEWGAEVMPWMNQFGLDVRRVGGLGAVPYLSDDVVVDVRTVATSALLMEGIDGAIAYFDAVQAGTQPMVERVSFSDAPHVDPSGLVLPIQYDRSASPGTTPPLPGHAVLFLDIGPSGIERYQMLPSISWWLDKDRTGQIEPADVADELAQDWAEAWTNDDIAQLRELYAIDAVLQDELSGVVVGGRNAIADQWALAPDTTWTVAAHDDSPAVHLWAPRFRNPVADRASLGVLAELVGSETDDCPGQMAVWWELDADGLIALERRFHSVADTRRCAAVDAPLPMGWWSGLEPPAAGDSSAVKEDLANVTQQITEGDVMVDIHNGSPSLAALVGWGLARFDLAGLALPDVRRVTFTQFTDYCTEVEGRTIRLPDEDPVTGQAAAGGWEIVLCFADDDVYIDDRGADPSERVRYVVLHELAHVWTDQNLDDARRNRLLEWLDVPTWNDRSDDWDRRGTEWAASFIAWGLMDVPMPLYELGDPPLEERLDGFQLLTGRRPLQTDS